MNLKQHFILFLVCFSGLSISCQSLKTIDTVKASSSYLIEGNFSILKTDKLGFFYLVNEDNEILKYDSNFKLTYKYSINTIGDVISLDVSNPQKIIAYYPDFQNIIFLDNTLSEIKRLNLENLQYWDIKGVALSNDNLIWIYDPINYRLIKINENGNTVISSNEFFFGELDGSSDPKVFAQNNSVYVFSNKELQIFDLFGQHLKTLKIENDNIQFVKNQFIILNKNNIAIDNNSIEFLEKKLEQLYQSDDADILDFSYLEKEIFLIDKHGMFKGKP